MDTNQTELTGVVGYLTEAQAKKLKLAMKKDGTTDLRFEKGNDKILMRIKNSDIRSFSLGKTSKSETKVHLLLSPGSFVETVVKMFRDVKAIDDPTLTRLTAAASVSVSFV